MKPKPTSNNSAANRKICRSIWISALKIIPFTIASAYGWSYHAHDAVSFQAARWISEFEKGDRKSELRDFFRSHSPALAYTSNAPDTTFKDEVTKPRKAYLGRPMHWLDVEFILGVPPKEKAGFKEYLERIRALPSAYSVLLKEYGAKKNALTGKPLKLYEEVGIAPWRIQQLFHLAIEAFHCAKLKEKKAPSTKRYPNFYRPVEDLFEDEDDEPTYRCKTKDDINQTYLSRRSDIFAATVFLGLLSHYVADLSSPMHVSADYNGWVTGQGGFHGYLENEVVMEHEVSLRSDLARRISRTYFRKHQIKTLMTDVGPAGEVAKMSLRLAADTYSLREKFLALDRRTAIVERGTEIPFGKKATEKKVARRKAAKDVVSAFKPLIIDQLAKSAILTAGIWHLAWERAGKPELRSFIDQRALPFPNVAPFVWPLFDKGAVERSDP